jgi:hypothetical protein
VHPYDALSRFENTLFALALILALRASLYGRSTARGWPWRCAGFSVLASDLSFLMAPGKGIEWWVGLFEGGTFLQSLFHANSLVPALAMAPARWWRCGATSAAEGRGFLVLAALLSLACPSSRYSWPRTTWPRSGSPFAVSYERLALAALRCGRLAGPLPLVLGSGGETMLIVFRAVAGALKRFARGPGASAVSGFASLVWPAGVAADRAGAAPRGRAAGARRAGSPRNRAPAALAAFALSGYVLG